jgi:hypothetical protein
MAPWHVPRDIAPNLYKNSRFNNRSVFSKLQNLNWIRNIGEVNNPTLLHEYVLLYIMLITIAPTSQYDEIFWKWTSTGKYFVASAYQCQFNGAMTRFLALEIWRAKAEPKCKFLAWLIMHDRARTVDNLARKNWPL